MTFSFHTEAEEELYKTVDYYEERQSDLGLDFSIEVYSAIDTIKANPTSWTKVSPLLRRRILKRFPFALLYHFDQQANHIFIVAVMHLRRKPGYWKDRI